jgi:hypothetical protein
LESPFNSRTETADYRASETSDLECLMTEPPGQKDWTSDLRRLGDPEFFAQWAAVRNLLFYIPTGNPEYSGIKLRYRALTAEYHRRIGGGLSEPNQDS